MELGLLSDVDILLSSRVICLIDRGLGKGCAVSGRAYA